MGGKGFFLQIRYVFIINCNINLEEQGSRGLQGNMCGLLSNSEMQGWTWFSAWAGSSCIGLSTMAGGPTEWVTTSWRPGGGMTPVPIPRPFGSPPPWTGYGVCSTLIALWLGNSVKEPAEGPVLWWARWEFIRAPPLGLLWTTSPKRFIGGLWWVGL